MTSTCVSSLSRASVFACAAFSIAFPWLTTAALGQTGARPPGDEPAKPRSEYLNDGVYQIRILHNYFDLYKPTRPLFCQRFAGARAQHDTYGLAHRR